MSIVRVDGDIREVKLTTTIWSYVVAAGFFFGFVLYWLNISTFNSYWQRTALTFLSWQEKVLGTFLNDTQICTAITLITFGITYCLLRGEIKDPNARCRQAIYYAFSVHALSMTGWLIAALKNLVVVVSH